MEFIKLNRLKRVGKLVYAETIWVLATGFWNDSGTWTNSPIWID